MGLSMSSGLSSRVLACWVSEREKENFIHTRKVQEVVRVRMDDSEVGREGDTGRRRRGQNPSPVVSL